MSDDFPRCLFLYDDYDKNLLCARVDESLLLLDDAPFTEENPSPHIYIVDAPWAKIDATDRNSCVHMEL